MSASNLYYSCFMGLSGVQQRSNFKKYKSYFSLSIKQKTTFVVK